MASVEFAVQFGRLGRAALNGAIGGAVCGAALGIVSMVLLGKQEEASVGHRLPVRAPELEAEPALLESTLAVLRCIPPSASDIAPTIVATLNTVCALHTEGGSGMHAGNMAKMQRAVNTLQRAIDICVDRGGAAAGIEGPAEELLSQCEDMLHNISLD